MAGTSDGRGDGTSAERTRAARGKRGPAGNATRESTTPKPPRRPPRSGPGRATGRASGQGYKGNSRRKSARKQFATRHEATWPVESAEHAEGGGPIGDLTNPAVLRALLRRHGLLRTNKSLGQHLLVSREALMEVVDAAELTREDAVLEVGAGPGVLTVELAERAGRVVAVELDRAMLPVLAETTASFANVEILPQNLLTVEPAKLFGEQPYKLVANLPYYITALTLRHFLEATRRPELLVVMVQREVAERIVAKAGDLSLLGLAVQLYGTPRIVATVPRDAFFPPPKVESAVVRVELHPQPLLPLAARDCFFQLAHAGFAEKRKQLHNSLARNLDVTPETVACWLAAAGIDPTRRAQTLSLQEWIRLTEVSLSGECNAPSAGSDAAAATDEG